MTLESQHKRLSRDEVYMATAYLFASRNICGRLDVGAVAVRDKRIIATGYNGPLLIDGDGKCDCSKSQPCEEAIHAEANLISFASKHGVVLEGATLYLTHFPCRKCQELIVQSGIGAIVFHQDYRIMDSKVLDFKNILIRRYEGRTFQISWE